MKEYIICMKYRTTGMTEMFNLSAPNISVLCDLIKIIHVGLSKDVEIVDIQRKDY